MSISPIDAIIKAYGQLLHAYSLPESKALELASCQVEIEAFGVTTHGLNVLNNHLAQLEKKIPLTFSAKVLRETPVLTCLDASEAIDVLAYRDAISRATQMAGVNGLALASVLNSGWIGALGYHLAGAARNGYMAIAWAQMSNDATVAPFGGREPRLSTNPIAFAFPTADGDPVIADFSTSATSNGKIHQFIARGERTPEPLLLDADGRPTDDPTVFRNGGSLLPLGGAHSGFRGTALALWVEALTAAAGGLPANPARKGGQNAHILILHIDSLGDLERYRCLIRDFTDHLLSSAPAPDHPGPSLPGARGWKSLRHARAHGLELSDKTHALLHRHAQALNLTLSI